MEVYWNLILDPRLRSHRGGRVAWDSWKVSDGEDGKVDLGG